MPQEPDSLVIIWITVVNYVIPFGFFFAGILIAAELNLLNDTLRRALIMGIPVSLVIVSMSLFSAEPAYQSHPLKFLMMCGMLSFYGSLTPQFFLSLRQHFASQKPQPKTSLR